MKRIVMQRMGAVLALSGMLLSAAGCNSVPPDAPPPTLPPQATMKLDFSDFDADNEAKAAQILPNSNWIYAVGNVAVWNTIVLVTLAVPVAAFGEALNHSPVRQSGATWVWAYSVVVDGSTYSAELRGTIAGPDRVDWAMYISKANAYSDVLWFTGTCDLNATVGTWTLNRDANNVTPFILIEWSRIPDADVASVKYTNIVPGGPENGGYVAFDKTDGATYDRHYEIFNKGQNNTTDIEWNHTTLAGRIKDPGHFSDASWHCWDNTRTDTDCAAIE